MKLAFAYIRRSSYKQQENNSVKIQKQHILEFASRNNLSIPEEFIFIEDVTSAYTKPANKRKQLMNLSDKMIEMNISTIVFHDVSRMDRTGYSFTIDFYRPLREKLPNLAVYTTKSTDPIDPEDLEMKMNFLLFHHESEVKSDRAVSSLVKDLTQGHPIRPGSKIPYGYIQKDKKLYPNEDAEIVSFIFFLYSWGHSFKKIAFLLNQAEIPSPLGISWGASSIEKILKNTVYTGHLLWHIPKLKDDQKEFKFKHSHESIVNSFYLDLHQQNKKLQRNYGRLDTPFLFLNKIKCQTCYEVLKTQNGSTTRNGVKYHYPYYVCKSCQFKVAAQEVHEKLLPKVLSHVHNLASSSQNKQNALQYIEKTTSDVDKSIQEIKSYIEDLHKKIEIAKQLSDRELELLIVPLLEQSEKNLCDHQKCKKNLFNIYELVNTDKFFFRFQNILSYHLGRPEQRLILLYFVDQILVTSDHQTRIMFKSNIFDDLVTPSS